MSGISRFKKNILIRKVLIILLLLVIYYNLIVYFFAPQIYTNPYTLIALLIYYIIASIDVMIRPLPDEMKITKIEYTILVFSIIQPFMFILAYIENLFIISQYFAVWNLVIIAYIGFSCTIIGGMIIITSRIQLGKYGTPFIYTDKDQKLVTNGLYKYIRHPMYLGAILMNVGTYLSFRSILILILISTFYILTFKARISLEEEKLISTFDKEYKDYIKRTKKLIPFIY